MHSLPPPVDSTLDAIGNTPVVRPHIVVPERNAKVFLILESLNPTGSYKDRMAISIIEEAERQEKLNMDTSLKYLNGNLLADA